jgi:very-short-patch-repair endonuclease
VLTKERARELRRNMTEAERRLWALLRRKKLAGHRFRRQAPIGPYYADFFCPRARLIIEVDGTFHGDKEQNERDEVRARWLEARGCRVIRFWNKHVFMYPDRVIDTIYGELTSPRPSHSHFRASETPSPPRGEGEQNRTR